MILAHLMLQLITYIVNIMEYIPEDAFMLLICIKDIFISKIYMSVIAVLKLVKSLIKYYIKLLRILIILK